MIIISILIIYISISIFFIIGLVYALDSKYQTEINKLHIYYNEKYEYDLCHLDYVEYV